MIISLISSVILISIVCIYFLSSGREYDQSNILRKEPIINVVKNVVVPTILNNQSYFFVPTKYKNMSFYQCVRSDDYVSYFIKNYGTWPECQDMFNIWHFNTSRGIFLDLGANLGSCSFPFAQAGVKVYAFEPLPNNLYPFSLTTFTNPNFTKYITIYPYALGNEEKDEQMHIIRDNWGASSIYYKNKGYIEKVHVKKLDQFDKLIPAKISMIKIDVEGAEYDLLLGSREFFKTHETEYMYIEVSCGKKENGVFEVEKLFNLLGEMGYDAVKKINCSKLLVDNVIVKKKKN